MQPITLLSFHVAGTICYILYHNYGTCQKLPYIMESKGLHKDRLILQNLPCFGTICVFRPLNPISPHKFPINRFSIVRPTRPHAGLPIIPCGSKVMAECWVTHHTSPCFYRRAYIVSYNILMKKMFATFLPMEQA